MPCTSLQLSTLVLEVKYAMQSSYPLTFELGTNFLVYFKKISNLFSLLTSGKKSVIDCLCTRPLEEMIQQREWNTDLCPIKNGRKKKKEMKI